jgi:hypothetical protein
VTRFENEKVESSAVDFDGDFDGDSDVDSDVDSDSDNDSDDDSTFGRRQYTWSRSQRPGFPLSSEETEKRLGYDGFAETLQRFLEDKYDAPIIANDIYVHDSIRMVYPSWIQTEVITNTVGLPPPDGAGQSSSSSSPSNTGRAPEFLLPSKDSMTKATIVSAPRGSRRQETVLISTSNRNVRTINTMSYRKAAQILLLFRCRVRSRESGAVWNELAYVSWFDTKVAAKVSPNRLYLVARSNRFGIVEVTDIERPILLIPKFGETVGATVAAKKELDKTKLRLRALQSRQSNSGGKSGCQDLDSGSGLQVQIQRMVLDSMWYYNEFYIDSWQDSHSYKNIF